MAPSALVERPRGKPPHLKREVIRLSENASRHGNHFAKQRPGFFEVLTSNEGQRVVVGRSEGLWMFLAMDFQTSRVYVSPHTYGLFVPS